MNRGTYHKYLTENIIKTFQKLNRSKIIRINSVAKKIVKKLEKMTEFSKC